MDKDKKLELRKDFLNGMPYTWSARVSPNRVYAKSDEPINIEEENRGCGVCGSNNVVLIYKDFFATNTGKSGEWEYKCKECGNYTVLELDD